MTIHVKQHVISRSIIMSESIIILETAFKTKSQNLKSLYDKYFPRNLDPDYNFYKLLIKNADNKWFNIYNVAIASGNIPVMQWCFVNNCIGDKYSCALAAYNNQLYALKWLISIRTEYDHNYCLAQSKRHSDGVITTWLNKFTEK